MKRRIKQLFHAIASFRFSKLIIVIETFLVLLVSIRVLDLAEMSIMNDYNGGLTFLTTMITAVWGAYGVSVSFYYNKAKNENLLKMGNSHEIKKIELNQSIDCDPINE